MRETPLEYLVPSSYSSKYVSDSLKEVLIYKLLLSQSSAINCLLLNTIR